MQHANAATSSTTSVGGGSGAGPATAGSAGGSVATRPPGGHHSGHSQHKFRHGLLQLMIHTIDPLHEGKFHELNYSLSLLL